MPFFSNIIGQEQAVTELREELQRGRTSHAYLLEGARGTGRLTLARAFAATVLCEADKNGELARMFAADTHPDYLELSRKERSLQIAHFVSRHTSAGDKIEHEPILEFIWRKPFIAGRLVLVVPDAERMNEAAANAFLKTLEEPPGDALIILTTSARDRLLSTIVSRCRRIRVCPLSRKMLSQEILRRKIADEEHVEALAMIAEGSLGRAAELSDGNIAEYWQWITEQFSELTPASALLFASGLVERCKNAGSDGYARRSMAMILLDLTALFIRNKMRHDLNPRSARRALQVLWDAGEQLVANVSYESVMHEVAFESFVAIKQG